jgi:hypothetical protein
VVTSPSPGPGGGGGSPRRVSGERESSLADPHGGPAATDNERKLRETERERYVRDRTRKLRKYILKIRKQI